MSTESNVTLENYPGAESTQYRIKPAGWLTKFALIDVGIHSCGHIKDGISLSLSDDKWYAGGVIAFRDLEAIYFAAKAHREKPI